MALTAKIFRNIEELLTLSGVVKKDGRHIQESDLGALKNATMIVSGTRVIWAGPERKLNRSLLRELKVKNPKEIDLRGQNVLPGFVECHTHLVFAGDRQDEFEARNLGATYQEISARGGGIKRTMALTRKASPLKLKELAQTRVDRFVQQGVTVVEVKSGYGLSRDAELKCLKVARDLERAKVVPTFLGPHALPPEFLNADDYVEYLGKEVLPEVAKKKLADRVDLYVEQGFFELKHLKRWFNFAQEMGFSCVAHVDQLTSCGGTGEAVKAGAISVDHLVYATDLEIKALGQAKTTAVLLPAADFYLKMDYPQARKLIDSGARVALATDFNPGTSPTQDLSFVGVLSRLEMKMSLAEVLSAYTYGGAAALGLENSHGALCSGYEADFCTVEGSWRDLFYNVGHHPISSTWRGGRKL